MYSFAIPQFKKKNDEIQIYLILFNSFEFSVWRKKISFSPTDSIFYLLYFFKYFLTSKIHREFVCICDITGCERLFCQKASQLCQHHLMDKAFYH